MRATTLPAAAVAERTPSFPYKYQRLLSQDLFKLLKLYAGDPSDPLSCEISLTTVEIWIAFETISYGWGEQTPQLGIFCEDQTGDVSRVVNITKNLNGVLRQLRIPKTSHLLWADAVCID